MGACLCKVGGSSPQSHLTPDNDSRVWGPQDHFHFRHQLHRLGVLRDTLRFNELLELREPRKALRLTVQVYYKESVQIKISQGRDTWHRVQRGTKHRCPVSFSHGVRTSPFPGDICHHSRVVLPKREARQSLGVQVLIVIHLHRPG